MNRRQFLKTLGILTAATTLPIGWVEAYPNFNPSYQYGDYVVVADLVDKKFLIELQEAFADDIAILIPPKYRKNISWIVQEVPWAPENRTTIAWKYTPKEEE